MQKTNFKRWQRRSIFIMESILVTHVHSLLFSTPQVLGGEPIASLRIDSPKLSASSEAESSAELNLAWRVGVRDYPQASANAGSRIRPIRPVEYIERIRLEHEACAFFG